MCPRAEPPAWGQVPGALAPPQFWRSRPRKRWSSSCWLSARRPHFPPLSPDDDTDKKFEITGDIRTRWERLDSYATSRIPGTTFRLDDAQLFPYRIRLGVNGELADASGRSGAAELRLWNRREPNQSFDPPFQNSTAT